ncbi:IS66 family insertion sequence element accessory protein TnpB, partial [Intestinimonas timonensis]
QNYYVACGYTDLRRGIDGLAAIVSQQYGGCLSEESLFLFFGRRTDRIKALYWSGDGYRQSHWYLSYSAHSCFFC